MKLHFVVMKHGYMHTGLVNYASNAIKSRCEEKLGAGNTIVTELTSPLDEHTIEDFIKGLKSHKAQGMIWVVPHGDLPECVILATKSLSKQREDANQPFRLVMQSVDTGGLIPGPHFSGPHTKYNVNHLSKAELAMDKCKLGNEHAFECYSLRTLNITPHGIADKPEEILATDFGNVVVELAVNGGGSWAGDPKVEHNSIISHEKAKKQARTL